MRKAEWIVLITTAWFVATAVCVYPVLPAVVASHWNISGQADGYLTRGWAVSIFPIMMAIISVLFLVIPRVDPKRENIQKFRKYFDYFIVSFTVIFYWMFLLFILWNLGYEFNFVSALIPPLCALFWIVGALLPHTELNWTIGIRTPWTISSDSVWKKTHRAGGALFKISAIIGLLGVVFPAFAIWFLIVPIVASTIYLVIYSYVLYERELKIKA
jgi:uncharacterized membrane protein